MSANRIGLADFINQVKSELLTDHPSKENGDPLFLIDEVEIEMSVGATIQGGSKLTLYVLDVNGSVEGEKVQKVTIKMTPILDRETREKIALSRLSKGQIHRNADATIKGPDHSSLQEQE